MMDRLYLDYRMTLTVVQWHRATHGSQAFWRVFLRSACSQYRQFDSTFVSCGCEPDNRRIQFFFGGRWKCSWPPAVEIFWLEFTSVISGLGSSWKHKCDANELVLLFNNLQSVSIIQKSAYQPWTCHIHKQLHSDFRNNIYLMNC